MAKVVKNYSSYESLLVELRKTIVRQLEIDGLSMRDLSARCGMANATVSRLLSSGESRRDNLESLLLISDRLGIGFRFGLTNRDI